VLIFAYSVLVLRKYKQGPPSHYSENNLIFLFREVFSSLRSGDGGSGPAYRQFASPTRGIGGEEGRISPHRSVRFAARRREVAGGEASGLAGGVEGESSASV